MIRSLFFGFLLLAVSVSTGACDSEFSVAGFTADEVFDDPKVERLAHAAARGDLDEIEAAVTDGANVNFAGVQEVTPLFWTYFAENKVGFEKLYQLGANPFHEDHKGRTVAAGAARNEDPAYLDILLRNGLDPNTLEGHRQVPIIFTAVSAERWPQFEQLMEYCSDLHWTGNGNALGFRMSIPMHYDMLIRLLEEGYAYNLASIARSVQDRQINSEFPELIERRKRILELLETGGVSFPIDLSEPVPWDLPPRLPPLYAKSCEERRKQ